MKLKLSNAAILGISATLPWWPATVLRADVIADSKAEFSGVQGQNSWHFGYRDVTTDGGGLNYDPNANFIEFTTDIWTGSAWDMNTTGAPWTYMGAEDLHPNGVNNGNEHWVIRRWVNDLAQPITPLAIQWNVRKQNTNCCNGVTGALYLNGVRVDSVVIAGNDGVGATRTFYVNSSPDDKIDLIVSPVGTDGVSDDGADGSLNWMTIDTTMPEFAVQPAGSLFIPAGAPDTDGDSLPDVWEKYYAANSLTKLNAAGDFDADGLKDTAELSRGTNPTVKDTDNDGLSDNAETGTGVFVGAADTGTDPLKADTDGDGLLDGVETGTGTFVSYQDTGSNPTMADTDGDGTNDAAELLLAQSENEFSGVQGQDNWYYGYRDFTADGGNISAYDPAASFIEFAPEQFGSQWDLNTAPTAPWTELGRNNSHPNGSNSGHVHWTIRRWVANELTKVTPVALKWHAHKNADAATCAGNGITGAIYINGQLADSMVIAGGNNVGSTRTYYANIKPGDIIDQTHSPRGTDNTDIDGCDGSTLWLVVDPILPANPVQPDGRIFIPAGAGDTDGDGIADAWEKIYYTNDLNRFTAFGDFDQDGLKDVLEFERDSDPTDPDTDDDGLSDLVETGTGTFVSATDTGTSPKKVDSDQDGRSDYDEVKGTPATDPNKSDTDGDGFSDTTEIAAGTNPNDQSDNPLSFVIANSSAEFSGTQGENGWYNGYRNYTQDGSEVNYDPATQFIPFTEEMWVNNSWDMDLGANNAPWTWIAREDVHPNGANSGGSEHWAIRRWVAEELTAVTPVGIIWHLRKGNTSDNGVTGLLYINGQLVDSKTIPGSNNVGFTNRFYANLKPGDLVDLALSPQGPNDRNDYSDASVTWFWVDTRLPQFPIQPNGDLFIPSNAADTDSDTLPDLWEKYYAGDLAKLTAAGDFDNDGLSNKTELERGTNPVKTDTDDDGLSDQVETGTGTYVSATDTGTQPKNADTDNDGLLDGVETNTGTYVSPTNTGTNPLVADTDGDSFSDGSEVATGNNPADENNNPNTTWIADSKAEFSGEQGQNGWINGYRDLPANATDNYDPQTDFTPFAPEAWTGTMWDLANQTSPWTEIGAENVHPSGPTPLQWPIRRWVATELTAETPLALRYHVHKSNVGGGNGVTAGIYINGQLKDRVTIAGNNATGVTRTYYAFVQPTDVVDLILSSRGTDNDPQDAYDGSVYWLQIDTAIPANARQPDGSAFPPITAGPELALPAYSSANGQVTLTWDSTAGATYKIEASADFKSWQTLKTGHPSAGAQTTYTDTLPAPRPTYRFYRIGRE